MQLIKLDATDSTNAHMRRLLSSTVPEDYTVVSALRQTRGRGQMGARWESETGKNLTFSLLRSGFNLAANKGFILNICVSLALYNVLHRMQLPNLSIKWPNDIMSGTSKIGGILIENQIQGTEISTSIIGIGLNVNQTSFNTLQNASSIRLLLGQSFNLDNLLLDIVNELKNVFSESDTVKNRHLWDTYESVLFKKGKTMTFKNSASKIFKGSIQGVSKDGKLVIAIEKDVLRSFDTKEVKMVY